MERAVDQQGLESDERSRAPAIPPGGVVLAVCVLLGVFAFFRVCFAAGSVVQTLGIATSDAEVADLGLAARAFSGVPLLAVYLPIIVLFLVWVAKANASARRLGAGGMKISTGWAVGWFLVPFVHLVMSVKVMSELWRASDPDADPSDPSAWWSSRTNWVVYAWWAAWVLGTPLSNFPSMLIRRGFESTALGVTMVIGNLLSVISAVLLIVVINRIQSRLARRRELVASLG